MAVRIEPGQHGAVIDLRGIVKRFRDAAEAETRPLGEQVFIEIVTKIQKETGIKGKNLFMPLRAALTGRAHGPEIYFLLPVIGRERTLKRLDKVLA